MDEVRFFFGVGCDMLVLFKMFVGASTFRRSADSPRETTAAGE
jgi:hypothetical protein